MARTPSRTTNRGVTVCRCSGIGATDDLRSLDMLVFSLGRPQLCRLGFGEPGLLVDTQHVACGIAEPGEALLRVPVDRPHDLPSGRNDGPDSRVCAGDHDRHQQAGLACWWAVEHPHATDAAYGVVEGDR